jgi:hypothetical protein
MFPRFGSLPLSFFDARHRFGVDIKLDEENQNFFAWKAAKIF